MAVTFIEQPQPILPLSLGSFSTLPPECFVHVLSFLPPPALATLCLAHRDLRIIVNEETEWGKAKTMCLIFHSLVQTPPDARSEIGYVLDVQRNSCTISMLLPGQKRTSQALFSDLHAVEIIGSYKISETKFVCLLFAFDVFTYFGLAGSFHAFEFRIENGVLLPRAVLPSISEFEKFKSMTICRIYERNRCVLIEACEKRKEMQYLFIHEIGTESSTSYLGKRIYTVEYHKQSSVCILKKDPKRSVKLSLRNHLSSILYVQDPWLVAKHFSNLENKVHYVFYHTMTGRDVFCYSQDIIKGVPPSSPADDHQPQVFIKDDFCLLYHLPYHIQAVLIRLDKQSSIPLTKDTQNLLRSFDRITDLDYQPQPDKSIKVTIEGERNFEKLRIESTVDLRSLRPSHRDRPFQQRTLDSSTSTA